MLSTVIMQFQVPASLDWTCCYLWKISYWESSSGTDQNLSPAELILSTTVSSTLARAAPLTCQQTNGRAEIRLRWLPSMTLEHAADPFVHHIVTPPLQGHPAYWTAAWETLHAVPQHKENEQYLCHSFLMEEVRMDTSGGHTRKQAAHHVIIQLCTHMASSNQQQFN